VSFWVYILASRRNGMLYIGMTDDLARRSWEHRTGAVPGFTRKYGVKMLVWFEQHETRESALQRERQLKKWNRAWKLQLIERFNPSWKDLADELTPDPHEFPSFPTSPLIPAQSGNLEIWVPAFAGTNGSMARVTPPSD
jgi:putative endonuclease